MLSSKKAIETGESFQNSKLKIKKEINSIMMETITLKLDSIINNERVEYLLPSIYYGISNDTCYIYKFIISKR